VQINKKEEAEMYDRKDYYYDPVNHYYTYAPDGSPGTSQGYAGDMYGDDLRGPDPEKKKPKKEKKIVKLTRSKLVALMLVMVMLAGVAGFGGAKLAGAGKYTITQSDGTVTNTGYDLKEATGSKMTIQQIADKCQDSVVSIRTESVSQGSWIREYVTEGAGSGVIFKSDGYILTNNHVVEGARKVTVTVDTKNGKTKDYDAKIIGTDASLDKYSLPLTLNEEIKPVLPLIMTSFTLSLTSVTLFRPHLNPPTPANNSTTVFSMIFLPPDIV
jgi:hypothetical protein